MTVKLCMDWSRMFLSLAFRLHNLQPLSLSFSTLHPSFLWITDTIVFAKLNKSSLSSKPPSKVFEINKAGGGGGGGVGLIYGIWKGRDFTSWSIWKGREFRHFGPWKGPKGLTCILWKSQEKRSGLRFMHILKRVQLQQLKGMWRFKLGIWKGCHLPIEDMQFCANSGIWKQKLDLAQNLPI